MSESAERESVIRFEPFELDLERAELRRKGRKVKLAPQPFKILALLATRDSGVVTREALRDELWGDETFVDFEHGINTCIKQIRQALGDDPENPRYVVTVPKQGYRFLTPTPASAWQPVEKEGEPKQPRSRLPYLVLLGVALFGLGWLVASLRKPAPPNLAVTRFEIETQPLDLFVRSLAFSRDGTKLAYVTTDGQIYVRRLDRDEVLALPNTQGGLNPVFSPDGEWVAFHDFYGGKLKKTPVSGGPAVQLTDWNRGTAFDADWEADDTLVLADRDQLYRVSANGGVRQRFERAQTNSESGFEYPRYPDALPGEKALLVTSGMFRVVENTSLYRMDTGEWRVLIENANSARYVPTGHIVFIRNDMLYAVGFDLDRLAVEGEPVPVLENLYISVINRTAQYSFSDTGSLAYVPAQWNGYRRRLVWVDREGNVEPFRSMPHRIGAPHISPKGERIVLTIYDRTRPGLWLTELSRETLTPFLPGTWAQFARWAPDGERLAFIGKSENDQALFTASLGTGDLPEKIARGIRNIAWSPDGNALVYQAWGREALYDMWTVSLGGDRTPTPYLEDPNFKGTPCFSPDGHWLAYASMESDEAQIYVRPFGREGSLHQISTDGGTEPLWSPDGREIFYRSGRRMMAVAIQTEPTFEASSPRKLFEGDFLRSDLHPWARNHDLSPDGKRFLMIQSEEEPAFTKIKIVLNWFEELKRLVPVDP